MSTGVYETKLKNGTPSFRGNISYKGTHISLGSYDTYDKCHGAYNEAGLILSDYSITIENWVRHIHFLPMAKVITLLNYRDNGIYIRNPIYLKKGYFHYYLNESDNPYIFDNEDLFYYSEHKIQCRGGHLFVSDFGLQETILLRYGLRQYSKPGKEYTFVNGNDHDFRYHNILIRTKYFGVSKMSKNNLSPDTFVARIHVNGDITIGQFDNEIDAAIAYNKAVSILTAHGLKKNYNKNFIEELSDTEYLHRRDSLDIDELHLLKASNLIG